MKKKILIFTDAFSGGGAEEVMRLYGKELLKSYEVVHIAKWKGPKDLPMEDYMINLNKKSSRQCFIPLYKYVVKFKPDILFTSTGHNNVLLLLLKKILKRKPKVIIRESSVASQMKSYSLKSKFYDAVFVRNLYKYSDKIIAQSKDIYNDLLEKYNLKKEQLIIINNPVILPENIEKIKGNNLGVSLLTIGRLSPEKGYERMFEMLKLLPESYHLRIMGDGIQLNYLKQLASRNGLSKRITFLGFLNEKEKIKEIQKSDIYIQTSYLEGFPNSLLQSVAMGIPAVAFNVPGGTKEIINTINGVLVQDGNIEEMATTIKDFDFNNYNANQMLIDIQERFGLNKILDQLRNIIENVTNE